MSRLFHAYSSLLGHNLKHAQVIQFLKIIKDEVGPLVVTVPELVQVYTSFEGKFTDFEAYFLKNQGMFQTEALTAADGDRAFMTRAIVAKVLYHGAYPMTEEEKEDIKRLVFIVNTYKNSERKDYEAETSYVRNMITEFRKYPALLTKFQLTEMVDKLEVINNNFETLYNERSLELFDRKVFGDMVKLRKEAVAALEALLQAITGRLLMPATDAVKAPLNSAVSKVNANVDQFTTIYHRHAGITGKKDNSTNNGEENAGTQTPDNTLPAAPDTPNQPPSGGPYPLDPNEHPSMGEH